MFHQTKEPLMEEYSIAKQIYRLSQADTCEIARNSVLQSGFNDNEKLHWVGSLDRWKNDILKTNVPNVRIRFRHKTWLEEWLVLKGESEVMDSLVQFATNQLISSPLARKASVIPMVPDMESMPQARQEDLEMFLNNEPPRPSSALGGKTKLLPVRETYEAPAKVPLNVAMPFYISGALFGGILAVAIVDMITRARRS
jgi:hypothetical protein